jgi:hypothetical protein
MQLTAFSEIAPVPLVLPNATKVTDYIPTGPGLTLGTE